MFKTHSATSIIPNEAFTSALGLLLLFIASWLMGCRAERFYNEKNTLAFSQDTVWFDTVFTRKPGSTYPISVTKIVSIKNPENLPVKANFILAGGAQSQFRVSIDGESGLENRRRHAPAGAH